jgi:predicted ATPase
VPVTRYFGRDDELRVLGELVAGGARLVTLLGMGGIGKTRLAIEAAGRLVAGGVRREAVWVPLVDVRDAEGLLGALLSAAGGGAPVGDPRVALAQRLAGRGALLVVDNAEHIVEEVANLLSALLTRAPDLVVLATSQRALLLDGEHLLRLQPLAGPAVDLLTDRIRQQRPDYAPDEAERRALDAIAARLDGLPLALELAASRLRQGSAAEALERLDPGALTDRRRDRPQRQRSLEDALDWTLATLPPGLGERFLELSVFRGEISVEAARAVTGARDVADQLVELADSSLLVPVPDAADRNRMLPTVRTLAAARLAPTARDALRARFLTYFLGLARRWRVALNDGTARALAAPLARDRVNLDEAMDLAPAQDAAEAATGTVIHTLWTGRAREVLPRIEALAGHPEAKTWPIALRGDLARCGHRLSHVSGQAARAAVWREHIRALLAEEIPDAVVGVLSMELALAALDRGALAEARTLYEAQIARLERAGGERRSIAVVLDALSRVHFFAGELDLARVANDRAAELVREQDDPQLAEVVAGMGASLLVEQDAARGLAAVEAILQRRAALGQPVDAYIRTNLALAQLCARLPAAVETARAALAEAKGDRRLEVLASDTLSVTLVAAGQWAEALPLAEAAEKGFRDLQRPIELPRAVLVRAACLHHLGDPRAEDTLVQAVRCVLAVEGRRHLARLVDVVAARWPERLPALEAARTDGSWRGLVATWVGPLGVD